jgi:hypothetical protein
MDCHLMLVTQSNIKSGTCLYNSNSKHDDYTFNSVLDDLVTAWTTATRDTHVEAHQDSRDWCEKGVGRIDARTRRHQHQSQKRDHEVGYT